MNPILAAGLLIGVFCGLWTFVMGVTGWYKDPAMMNAFWVVVVIQLFGLVWGLRQTARQGRGWASQVLAGTLMSVIAGVVIVASSLLFTIVFFPEYFAEIERMGREVMRQQGKSEEEIATALEASRLLAAPMTQAMAGFTGTLITGIVASAAISLVVRAKPMAGVAPPAAPGPNHM
jgi:Protein of unknown function (DUF4199)